MLSQIVWIVIVANRHRTDRIVGEVKIHVDDILTPTAMSNQNADKMLDTFKIRFVKYLSWQLP